MSVAFSYGSVGFLSAVDIDIIPYKPFIELGYFPVRSLDEAVAVLKREANPNKDSVEGIMYTLDEGVIMSGNFVDHCDRSK